MYIGRLILAMRYVGISIITILLINEIRKVSMNYSRHNYKSLLSFGKLGNPLPPKLGTPPPPTQGSPPVKLSSIDSLLTAVEHGHWKRFPPPKDKLEEVQSFINDTRFKVFKMPTTLDRADRKCGNATIASSDVPSRRFRALCNPGGDTPCCYDNHCVSRSEEQCACPGCFDLRSDDLHADFATYIPDDPANRLTAFTSTEEICDVMTNVTLQFFGDSLVSHVYLALLAMAHGGDMSNLFTPEASEELRSMCQGQRMHVITCRKWLQNTWKFPNCKQPAYMSSILQYRLDPNALKTAVENLVGRPNSVMYVGIGLHQDFNTKFVNDTVIQTIVKARGNNKWPFIVYAGNHAWGMLRHPFQRTAGESVVLGFNQRLKALLSPHNISYMDTFGMTKNVISYDGTHYGQGVNRVKAQVLLNVIQRLKLGTNSIP